MTAVDLRYTGPAGQVNRAVSGRPLEPGAVYPVPAERAYLLARTRHFELADAGERDDPQGG